MLLRGRRAVETTRWLKTAVMVDGGLAAVYFETPDGPVSIYSGFTNNVQELFGRVNEVLFDLIYSVPRGEKSILDFLYIGPTFAGLRERKDNNQIYLGSGDGLPKHVVFARMQRMFDQILGELNTLQALAEAAHEPGST